MKTKFVLLFMLGLSLFSCSTDDSNDPVNPGDNNVSGGDFLPLSTGNHWDYQISGSLQSGSDHLFISGDITANGNTYKKFTTEAAPLGFYASALRNNGVRKDGDRLLLTGTTQIPFSDQLPLSISVNDFVVLDESASVGATLDSESGVIPYQFEGYDLDFNYTMSSSAGAAMATYTAPNGEVYTNVKPVTITLNLSVTMDLSGIGLPGTATIIDPQNVVVSTHYFAEGIGVVNVDTDIAYTLSQIASTLQLPIPQSVSENQTEVLVDYNVE